MKFSDMMGKGSKSTATEAEADVTETSIPAARTAPPVPDAPIRFSAPPTDAAASVPTGSAPSIADVMSELAPRGRNAPASVPTASREEVDASAWLEGITTVADDLLPS